jgi:hypothetical protein
VEGFIQPEEAQVSEEEREYLNEMIRSLNNQLVDALRERDDARRIAAYQYAKHSNYGDESFAMRNFFQFHKWEHLKEDGK